MKNTLKLLFLPIFLCFSGCSEPGDSYDFLPEWVFTSGMEGPATDSDGNIYAVNYEREGTIGVIHSDGSHYLFMDLPEGSVGNGIRFDKEQNMLVADYTGHNILKIIPATKQISVFAHSSMMNQPNDLVVSPSGNIYASDPDWTKNTGQLWLINAEGNITLLEKGMGTTNGIEVNPEGTILYVNESVQRNVWAYDISSDGYIINKRLFHHFPDYGMDGMRCDSKGNLYICRYDKGTVAILDTAGKLIQEIQLKGKKPSNLTFGGKNNQECYVTLQDRGCFEIFTALYPGRE